MKKYWAVLAFIICANSFAENPVEGLSGHYMISHIIGVKPQPVYQIRPVPPVLPQRGYAHGGNNILFDAQNLSFESYYTAECGNDCFPSSKGTYSVEGEQHIRLYLTHVAQGGFCEETYDRAVEQDLGLFLVEKDDVDGVITLTFSGV